MQEKHNIESIFKQSFESHRVEPSEELIGRLKRRLLWSDYFSLNFRKVNVVYTAALVVVGLVIFIPQNNTRALSAKAQSNNDAHNLVLQSENHSANITSQEEQIVVENDNREQNSETNSEAELLLSKFNASCTSGCQPLTVHFKNVSKNANEYKWQFGDGAATNTKDPVYTFTKPGTYNVNLVAISAKGDIAKYSQQVIVYEKPSASIDIDHSISDINSRKVVFKNLSENAVSSTWSFGDNTVSTELNPEHVYANYKVYDVSLIAMSNKGCTDTITYKNTFVAEDFGLVFPQKFKPNALAQNDGNYLRPENAAFVFYPQNKGASNYILTISNSSGSTVFNSSTITKGWNGYYKGRIAAPGQYRYSAEGTYPNGQAFKLSGDFSVIIDRSYNDLYDH